MRQRKAFSLVELLVVIGIMLVIASIALPMLIRSYSRADVAKQKMDLNTIGVALEAYRSDYGDLPRVPSPGLGAAVLCKALVGPGGTTVTAPAWATNTAYNPGDLVTNGGTPFICIKSIPATGANAYAPTSNASYWAAYSDVDGADGLGHRVRVGMGKPKPAYLQVDRIKVRGGMLVNKDGAVVLYYPANLANPDVSTGTNHSGGATSLYNYADNAGLTDSSTPAASDLNKTRVLFGDKNYNGRRDAGEVVMQGPYILWLPGADGAYKPSDVNPSDVTSCDDITNFDR
jgi:prepilin-type N-terminal cleavage/methylation domain-containing protein